MIAWMIYCVLIGGLLSVAALAAEWIGRLAGRPVRWGWAIAIALTAVLAALAPNRRSPAAVVVADAKAVVTTDVFPLPSDLMVSSWKLPSFAGPFVGAAWIIASGVLGLLMFGVHRRLTRARRTWPLADLHGARVRVSPETGPVVIGFNRPEIVVPRWVLARSADEQRLVIAHESEHVTARDTVLLVAGSVACAVLPWNPAVWFMFSRLRLAVELDCDARVLRRGVGVQSYGTLLIDVASNASPLRFGAAAFANSPSHLHQRILAMKNHAPKFARLRGGIIGLFGAAALLAACSAELPTAAEIDRMDVGAAEKRLSAVTMDDSAIYVVDQKEVPRIVALAIKPEELSSVEVVRPQGERVRFVIATRLGEKQRVEEKAIRVRGLSIESAGGPMILIDGARSSGEMLKKLDRMSIASVEVVKGPGALQAYGEDGRNGVIRVTTKK